MQFLQYGFNISCPFCHKIFVELVQVLAADFDPAEQQVSESFAEIVEELAERPPWLWHELNQVVGSALIFLRDSQMLL